MMSESPCANCGDEILQGASVCDNCGMPVSEVATAQETPPQEVPLQQAPSLALPPHSSPPPPPVEQPNRDLSLPKEAPPPEASEQDKPGWRRRYRVPILLVLPLLLTLLLGGTAYALIHQTNGDDLGITNLAGTSSVVEPQRTTAEDSSETAEGEAVKSPPKSTATVAEQEPPAGEQEPAVAEMAGEDLSTSAKASKEVNLPDVRGRARDEAVRLLEGAGFEVEEETVQSSAANEGYVVEQSPRGGKEEFAETGSTVKITVGARPAKQTPEKAKSSAPPKQPTVPEGVGKKVEEAKQTPEKTTSSAPRAEDAPSQPTDTKAEEPKAQPPPNTKAGEPNAEPPPLQPDTKVEDP